MSEPIGYTSKGNPIYSDWNHPCHQLLSLDEKREVAKLLLEIDELNREPELTQTEIYYTLK